MAERKKSINYLLKEPFEYAMSTGEMGEASFLTLLPPTSKHRDECAVLEQAFYQSIPAQEGGADEPKKGPTEEIDIPSGSEVMAMLAMSKDVDLANVLLVGARLLIKGKRCLVEGDAALTPALMDEIGYQDLTEVVGTYLVGFILASALDKLKTN